MDWTIIITSGLAGVVLTVFGQYLVARMGAPDRAADRLTKYLSLADSSVDQLEERINYIGILNAKIDELTAKTRSQTLEIGELKSHRDARDDQMEAMQAHIASLQEQINKDTEERQALRRIIEEKDNQIKEVKEYLSDLLDWFEKRSITDFPVPPDDLLDTHSKIKLKNRKRK